MTNHRFKRCGKDVEQLVGKLIRTYYQDTLQKLKLRVDLLFCYSEKDEAGNPKGPPIKHNGVTAAATVKIIGLRDRVLGMADVLISIDGELWPDLTEEQKAAVLDHELYHVQPKQGEGEDGGFKFDDMDRPLLKLRQHDYEFGWFKAIAARHGEASLEVQQALSIKKESAQLFFDFPATQPELPPAMSAAGVNLVEEEEAALAH